MQAFAKKNTDFRDLVRIDGDFAQFLNSSVQKSGVYPLHYPHSVTHHPIRAA